MVNWRRVYLACSLGLLLGSALMAAQIVLLEPFRGFQGVLVLTNSIGEGWLEAVLVALSLPGWAMIFHQNMKTLREGV